VKPATAAVLRLLRSRGSEGVTGHDALREASVYRLSARVMELRQAGYTVQTDWRTVDGTRFAVYRLVGPVKPEQLRLDVA